MTYGIISDTHNHNWSLFADKDQQGINTRLRIILNETLRAARAVKDAGGHMLFHAGDMFHVRGSISPSVLNPTIEVYRQIIEEIGLGVAVIPGNHDLETRDAQFYMSTSSALKDVGVEVCDIPTGICRTLMVPWISKTDELRMVLENLSPSRREDFDLIIHAPVNNVIMGIPDSGLDADYLGRLGFRRVFAGHYHNHKNLGNGVYSIGALTHQTFSDIGSKAGFLIVTDDEVKYQASHAPKFVDFDANWSDEEMLNSCNGNYVRARVPIDKESEIRELRKLLESNGAVGISIHPIRSPKNAVTRPETVEAGATLQGSISEFVKLRKFEHAEKVEKACSDILQEVS